MPLAAQIVSYVVCPWHVRLWFHDVNQLIHDWCRQGLSCMQAGCGLRERLLREHSSPEECSRVGGIVQLGWAAGCGGRQ